MLYTIKTRLGYVFPLCFPHGGMNYLMSLRNVKSNNKISCKSDTGQPNYYSIVNYTRFSFTEIAKCLKLWGCCLFWKTFLCKIVLLLNCRSNVHIPQFELRNCQNAVGVVVSTLEYDAESPGSKSNPGEGTTSVLYFFSCFDTFDFMHIFFSFTFIFFS